MAPPIQLLCFKLEHLPHL